ncbi:DUF2975 domain-containing protein [[Clostridium] cellulosi]
MNHQLSVWLKLAIIVTGICVTVIYFLAFPFLGKDIISDYPEFRSWFWPWLLYLWLTAVPCYIAIVSGWKVVKEIGRDHSFCIENAKRLKLISILAATDSALVLIGNIIFLLLNMNHISVILVALLIIIAGMDLSVLFAALSNMVMKATKLREENELTI